jgi:hypothetical protein
MDLPAAIASVRAAYDIAKTLKGAMDEIKVNEVRINLQEAILDAQENLRDVRDELDGKKREIIELKAEISRLTDWSAEKAKWEVRKLSVGVYGYVEKAFTGKLRDARKLCVNCFDNNTKLSTLQMTGRQRTTGYMYVLECPSKCPPIDVDGWADEGALGR